MNTTPAQKFYTAAEVAQIMRVTQRTITIKTGQGLFPGAFKIGYEWRYPQEAIDAYIDAHRAPEPRAMPQHLEEETAVFFTKIPPRSPRARARRQAKTPPLAQHSNQS